MVEEFAGRFPQSALLSYVYTQGARACQQKADIEGVVSYGEKSLKLDPDNIYSMLILSLTLAQPHRQDPAAEGAQRLNPARQYADRSLILLDTLKKPEGETEEDFLRRKAALSADAHVALGTVEMQTNETAKAIQDFKTAISLSANPNPQLYFRMGEIYENEGENTKALEAFSQAAKLGAGSPLGDRAQQRAQNLTAH